MRFSVLFFCLAALAGRLAAQTSAPPAPSTSGTDPAALGLSSFTNTLGMTFLPVKGKTVLFSKFETRVSDFDAFIKASKYDWALRPHFEQGPDHPVVGINLQDAIQFCAWLTETERQQGKIKPDQLYRLPSNDEWSAAAGIAAERGEEVSTANKLQEAIRFVWGLEWPPPVGSGNFAGDELKDLGGTDDGFRFTSPVGKFKATPDGLFDVAGNVWEWTLDRELAASTEGTMRGGSWAYFRRECLTTQYVYRVSTKLRAPTMGFRCVFEDKQRTAAILAALSAERSKADQQRKEDLLKKDKVDSKAVEKVMQASAASGDTSPVDPSTLGQAAAGKPFKNSLRMSFVPLQGTKVLFGTTEITVAQFGQWLTAKKQSQKQPFFPQRLDDPAVNISWNDANAFTEWLTAQDRLNSTLPANARYRLPSDHEWSVAAGLPDEKGADPAANHQQDKDSFPWGTAWPPPARAANLDAPNIPGFSDTWSYTAPAGSTSPNDLGIYDLGGNVSEWCNDPWPTAPDDRVVRGGSWITSSREALLTSTRRHGPANAMSYDIGLRLVIDFGN